MPDHESVDNSVNLAFRADQNWRRQATGYIATDGYRFTHEWQTLSEDSLADKVGQVSDFVDLVQLSEERTTHNSYEAHEIYAIARVPGADTRVMIRRVDFVHPITRDGDRVELHSLCFSSTTDSMLEMLRASNEVLNNFAFGTKSAFPGSWLSKYHRYAAGESEFVVYRHQPKELLSNEDFLRGDWSAPCGIGWEIEPLRTTSRRVAGVDSIEISFRRKIETTELFGTRVCVPLEREWFVFQLLSPAQDFGIERGRLERVLDTVRVVPGSGDSRAAEGEEARETETPAAVNHADDSESSEIDEIQESESSEIDEIQESESSEIDETSLQESEPGEVDETELRGPEAKRDALSWTEHPGERATFEMRVMLDVLGGEEPNCDLKVTVWFMDRDCSWVLGKLLGGEQIGAALEEQRNVFGRAIEQHTSGNERQAEGASLIQRLAEATSLPKSAIERVLSCPGGQMYIGTLAKVAVALGCPLFGFEPVERN